MKFFKGANREATGSLNAEGKVKQTTKSTKRTYAKAVGGGGKPYPKRAGKRSGR